MEDARSTPLIDTLLLVGLPASGKSVLGRLLTSGSDDLPELGVRFGPALHLDDYLYVRIMWRISEIVQDRRHQPLFLEPDGLRFVDPREWGALVNLLNEEYADLERPSGGLGDPAAWVLDRLETAHVGAGMPPVLADLQPDIRGALVSAIEDDANAIAADHASRRRAAGQTVVIEFSRGGPDGASVPLAPPYGYAHALPLLSAEILRRAVILYVRITPEESRRRNAMRAVPSAGGSVLRHSVPEAVMSAYYGIDDMPSLIAESEVDGTVMVRAHGSVFHVPVATFDNSRASEALRHDGSSIRSDPAVLDELLRAFSQVGRHLRDASPPRA